MAAASSSSSSFSSALLTSASKKFDLNYRIQCPDCRNEIPNIIEDFASGDMICRDCGNVLGSRLIDTRSEWRSFSSDGNTEDPSRVGGPSNPLLDGAQLDTIISTRDGSATANTLNKLQTRTALKASERSLIAGFQQISAIAELMGLPKMISDRAKQVYKIADDGKLLKGKSNDGIIAACIYIACRVENVTRTFKEISSVTRVSKKDIGRCFKVLQPYVQREGMGAVSTADFVNRYCSHLNLNMEIQKAAAALSEKANQMEGIAGKSPISVASASIYMITLLFPQYSKTAKEISTVSGVSEVTIKNTYKELYPYRHSLIGPEIVSKAHVDSLPPG